MGIISLQLSDNQAGGQKGFCWSDEASRQRDPEAGS